MAPASASARIGTAAAARGGDGRMASRLRVRIGMGHRVVLRGAAPLDRRAAFLKEERLALSSTAARHVTRRIIANEGIAIGARYWTRNLAEGRDKATCQLPCERGSKWALLDSNQ